MLLVNQELEECQALKCRFGLLDAHTLLQGAEGPKFTWRHIINGVLKQSCLDRFYLSNQGWWISSPTTSHIWQTKASHTMTQFVSPAVYTLHKTLPCNHKNHCSSKLPFKSFKNQKTYYTSKWPAWQASNPSTTNPRSQVYLATRRLHLKYKELQPLALSNSNPRQSLALASLTQTANTNK